MSAEPAGALLCLGESSISPSAPTGVALHEDGDLDAIQDEIRKLESLTERPDWERVIKLSTTILGTKSKDLRVACWLSFGLFVTRGYPGLAEGLSMLRCLIDKYWPELFPPLSRSTSRLRALDWLGEQVVAMFNGRSPSSGESEALRLCARESEAIAALVSQNLVPPGGAAAGNGVKPAARLRGIAEQAQRRLASVSAPSAAPSPAVASAPQPAVTAGALPQTPQQARAALLGMTRDLLHIAGVLLREDPRDPMPYRLSRLMLWGEAARVQADAQGRLAIPGPSPDESKQILAKLRALTGVDGLSLIEQAIQSNPFWLDLQHVSWSHLTSLGSEFSRAAQAVQTELAGLIELQPKLAGWKFRSGTTLASCQARAWVNRITSSAMRATPASVEPGDQDSRSLEAADAEARGLAAAGNVNGALRLLAGSINACGDGRQRFQRRLRLARLAAEFDKPQLALAQLEILREDIDRFGLEAWEPQLCAEVLAQQLHALHGVGPAGGDQAAQLAECRRRLCRVAPDTALQLPQPGQGEHP